MQHNTPAIRNWINFIHGASAGDLIHICGTGVWGGRLFPATPGGISDAADYAGQLSDRELPGVYMRMSTIDPTRAGEIEPGGRGGAELSGRLSALWADVDYDDPGHKHTANRPDIAGYDPRKRIRHPLPADEAAAIRVIEATGLPAPTVTIRSGAGLYPIWKLTEPEDLRDQIGRDLAARTSERLQELVSASAAILGFDYGTGVGNLDRVLRIPGTIHRKVPDNPRRCQSITPLGGAYDLYDLSVAVEENLARLAPLVSEANERWAQPRPTTTVERRQADLPASPGDGTGDTPLDRFERATPWEDILIPHGWTIFKIGSDGTVYWTRPGKDRRDGNSATTNNAADRDRMYCFSTSAGLPVDVPMTKGFVYAELNHAGDLNAAASALARAGFGSAAPAAAPAAPSEWVPPAAVQPDSQHTDQPDDGRTTVGGVTWLPPTPIPADDDPDAFPVEVLPPALRGLVEGVSKALEVPADPVALMAMAAASAIAAPRVAVSNDRYDWLESTSLYTLTAMPPGERKSAIARAVARPLWLMQFEMAEEHKEWCAQEEHRIAAERGLSANPVEANSTETAISEIKESADNPPRILLPADTTVEALASEMDVNGGYGAILDAEGAIASILTGRYTRGDATNTSQELILSGYDGEPYVASRVTRGRVTLRRPNLALGLLTQTSVLERLVSADGMTAKGLLDRFLVGRPVTRIGTRSLVDAPPVPAEAKRDWEDAIRGMVARLPKPDRDLGIEEITKMFLSAEARDVLDDYRVTLEPRMADGADLEGMRGWASKAPGRIMRIAALLHLISGAGPDEAITGTAMRAAIAIGRWALKQAKSVLGVGAADDFEATTTQCSHLLNKLRASGKTSFTEREVKRLVRAAWATRDRIRDAIEQLEELGYLRSNPVMDAYGRPQGRYLLNPLPAGE